MRNCLQRGVGITLCPAVSVRKELHAGRLVELSWDDDPLETTTLMIWHAEKWCSPLLKHFMRIAEGQIRSQE
jgi:DNA-binding transcriptional LysR family regulator